MTRQSDPRDTRAYKKLARQVVREEPLCWLQLPGCTIVSTTADHIATVFDRPDLALERANLRGACKHCNSSRGRKPAQPTVTQRAPALDWFDG